MKNKDFTNAARNVVNEQHITKLKEHLEKRLKKSFKLKLELKLQLKLFYLELTAFKSLFYL